MAAGQVSQTSTSVTFFYVCGTLDAIFPVCMTLTKATLSLSLLQIFLRSCLCFVANKRIPCSSLSEQVYDLR